MAVPLDGVPIGDGRARLRSPRSVDYEKTYKEGIGVARALVRLDLDGNIRDLELSDAPDIIMHALDGHDIHIEHTFAMDQDVVAWARRCEETTNALWILAERDSDLATALEFGPLYVWLRDPGRNSRPSAADLTEEIAALRERWVSSVSFLRPTAGEAPHLNRARAQISYKRGTINYGREYAIAHVEQHAPFNPGASARLVLDKLATKREAARRYNVAPTPLWLVISVDDEHFDVTGARRTEIDTSLRGVDLGAFDRVIIDLLDQKPIVRDR